MSLTKIVRDAGNVTIARATWGGSQNFLGARWVGRLVDRSPAQLRERVALRLLSLSPHYFYARDIRAEAERNRRSRQALVDTLIAPHLIRAARVLDYGCGPGYMACAVAARAEHVDAVDISSGVLACAKALNGRPNISYLRPDELRQEPETVDLAYSFAVVQHLRTELLVDMLGLLADKLRPDGNLLLHFAVPGQGGWRTEAEWTADQSIVGRAKLRYGLNCFGRSVSEMEALVSGSGFTDVAIRSLSGSVTVPGDDDITQQHWLTARRP
jgi:SAM-dependent methyltransferase